MLITYPSGFWHTFLPKYIISLGFSLMFWLWWRKGCYVDEIYRCNFTKNLPKKAWYLGNYKCISAEHTHKDVMYLGICKRILQEIAQKPLFTSGFTCVFCWKFAKIWNIDRHLHRYFLINTCKIDVNPHSNLIQIMNILIKKIAQNAWNVSHLAAENSPKSNI